MTDYPSLSASAACAAPRSDAWDGMGNPWPPPVPQAGVLRTILEGQRDDKPDRLTGQLRAVHRGDRVCVVAWDGEGRRRSIPPLFQSGVGSAGFRVRTVCSADSGSQQSVLGSSSRDALPTMGRLACRTRNFYRSWLGKATDGCRGV